MELDVLIYAEFIVERYGRSSDTAVHPAPKWIRGTTLHAGKLNRTGRRNQ
jgi:hypothetical protein